MPSPAWKPRVGMKLSCREKQVLELLRQRKGYIAIAIALGIAVSTLQRRHIYKLGAKLGLKVKRGITEAEHVRRIVERARELGHLD